MASLSCHTRSMCLHFLSHMQKSGFTVLVGTVVVAFDPQRVSSEGSLFPGMYNWHPSSYDNDMKTFSYLFSVRIADDVELDCCPCHLLINSLLIMMPYVEHADLVLFSVLLSLAFLWPECSYDHCSYLSQRFGRKKAGSLPVENAAWLAHHCKRAKFQLKVIWPLCHSATASDLPLLQKGHAKDNLKYV